MFDTEILPIVEQGPFRRFASGAMLRYQPNRVVVLSGPGGYRIASAEGPLNLYDRLTESFTHYTIIDTAVNQASRAFTHAHSSDGALAQLHLDDRLIHPMSSDGTR